MLKNKQSSNLHAIQWDHVGSIPSLLQEEKHRLRYCASGTNDDLLNIPSLCTYTYTPTDTVYTAHTSLSSPEHSSAEFGGSSDGICLQYGRLSLLNIQAWARIRNVSLQQPRPYSCPPRQRLYKRTAGAFKIL